MAASTELIWWFQQATRQDVRRVGGKGANLGELTRAGISVPPGFIVAADAYLLVLQEAGLSQAIHGLLADLDLADLAALEATAAQIRTRILAAALPEHIAQSIRAAYRDLNIPLVAVRSSATAEDLTEASFAGQQSTFLNVHGADAVVAAVQACWASLFAATAIAYRARHGFDHLTTAMAVPVQKMVQSEVAGVLFTADPVTGDRGMMVIEAAFGLGEALVSGAITPDLYRVSKRDLAIHTRDVSLQDWKLVRAVSGVGPAANTEAPVPPEDQSRQKLSDDQIRTLAELGLAIERHFGTPQDIEWAVEGTDVFIVQARPITTL